MLEPSTPPEYLQGSIEFYGCQIYTTPAALIPRVETEFLPDFIVPHLKPGMTVLDLCSGTGCLGLALKKACPGSHVILSDISPDAVALAQRNAHANHLDVEILCGDFLETVKDRHIDIIVCNPPYIREDEYPMLQPSVRDHEPKLALVSGPTGLEFYERLAAEATLAKLFLEIGTGQGPAVQKIFGGGEVKQDLAGHDRYFVIK